MDLFYAKTLGISYTFGIANNSIQKQSNNEIC